MASTLATVAVLCATTVGAAARRTAVVDAVERVSPAVVGVRTKVVVSEPGFTSPFQLFFRDFYAPSYRKRERVETRSQGSGVIIDPSGFVVTNYHVIAAGGDIEIELQNTQALPADVVGTSPDHDIAVLKARSKGKAKLPFVRMASSDDLMIGETVIAIGNPFGLSHTVTTGVVSALHRSITTEDRVYADFIQTDAAINPGNSGGPLLTINGALVGVNTAIYGKAQGIGFAIPIDEAKRIVSDLLRYGEVRRAYFGFEVQDLTEDLAASFRVDAGALIAEVDPKGPANKTLRAGDIVTAIGGIDVRSAEELRLRLGDYTVGSAIALDAVRRGKQLAVTLRPEAMSPQDALARLHSRVGIEVVALSAAAAQRAGVQTGTIAVKSVARSSPAGRVGLRPGHLIRAVNSVKVIGRTAFGKALARSYWRGRVSLLIQSGRRWQEIAFQF